MMLSVIIVNWNGVALLKKCLEGLRGQEYKPSDIALVDNGSVDGSVDFVAQNYPEVRTIALQNNAGFSAGNNIALESMETECVALLNNDAVPHPLWLETLVEALGAHPEAGFAASKMLFHENPDVIDRAGDTYTRAGTGLFRGRIKSSSNYRRQEWILGPCAGALYDSSSLV